MFHYTDKPLPTPLRALIAHRVILSFATGLFGVFLPIFLYQNMGENVTLLALFYALSFIAYGTFSPLVMHHVVTRIGMRNALMFGTLMGAAFYGVTLPFTEDTAAVLIVPLFLTGLLFRLFYWVPYFTDFALISTKADRARQTSLREALMTATSVVTPLVAALIITHYSFSILFALGVIIYIAATIPLFFLPRIHERFTWDMRTTLRALVARKNRHFVLAYIAEGVELGIQGIIWPLVIYLLLDGRYVEIGALSSAVVAVTIIAQLLTGRLTDTLPRVQLLHIGTALYAVGWLVKVFVATAFHIFVADLYHRITRIFMKTPFEAITYDFTESSGHYVDEYSVLREVAEQIGRSNVLLIVAAMTFFYHTPLQWLFVIAAIAAIAMNTLRLRRTQKAP